MHALFKSTQTRRRKIVSNTLCILKENSKKVITLSKDPNYSIHRTEVGRHKWYSNFCDADKHMPGHITQTKMLFQTRRGQHRQNRLTGNKGRKQGIL